MDVTSTDETPVRRTRHYDSARRREQARRTRQRVLAAAREEFLRAGWTGTTIRAVAAAAGVSVPTVELAFGTKAQLLKEAIDVAIAGDDEPVAVLDRPAAAVALAERTVQGFLIRVAGTLTDGQRRSAGLGVVLEAAASDPALRELAEQRNEQRLRTAAWIVDGMARRGPLRPGLDRTSAVDTVWLLMDPAVFCRLTDGRGWTSERYAGWFSDSVRRLLTEDL